MAQITKMLMGIVVASLVISGFMQFYTGGVDEYNVSDYNNTTAAEMQGTFDTIKQNTNSTKERLIKLQSNQDFLDQASAFLFAGYSALKNIASGFTAYFTMITTGVKALPLSGSFTDTVIVTLTTLTLLAVIAGLFKVLFKVKI